MTKRYPTRTETDQTIERGGFQDIFQGATAIYVIERDGRTDIFLGDYQIDALAESWPEQIRANRERGPRERKPGVNLPPTSLQDQVLIAVGPQVSAKQAIAALERVIQSITGEGLLIGEDPDGYIAWEQVSGEIKV